jgi:hypothetical protein
MADSSLNALREFATRYTAAWCSQDPAQVASFYSPTGSLTVNTGTPATGRIAIAEVAKSFMVAFPDLQVLMDNLSIEEGTPIYRWTLLGTNSGPGGTGRSVRISGFEKWRMGDDGLIANSEGHFDQDDYDRQLRW